jgi:2-dehydropantoate 2-reductase
MKTLIYGAGPIGRWLALRMHQAGLDVTLLARNESYRQLVARGIVIVDGLTGERLAARPKLVDRLGPGDSYDLVVVAMQKSGRIDVCPTLAANRNLKNVLFLGNDVSGFQKYASRLPANTILLGFPGVGGGWEGDDLVIMDREKASAPLGEIYFGELDGSIGRRTVLIKNLFDAAGIGVSIEKDMDGWLKYHFAFMAPTAGAVFAKGGEMRAVASDSEAIHLYCRACREAGDVLRKIGYRRRQPPVFNLYYWLPRWLEPVIFGKLFASRNAEIRFGLHVQVVGPELREMAEEFEVLKRLAGLETPSLDMLLDCVPREPKALQMEEAS